MPYSFSPVFGRILVQACKNFLANNDPTTLGFDSTIKARPDEPYPLGNNLHYIFTTKFEMREDIKAQQTLIDRLAALGITYDSVLDGTIKNRSGKDRPEIEDQIEILDKATYETTARRNTPTKQVKAKAAKKKTSPIKEMPGKAPPVAAPSESATPKAKTTNGHQVRKTVVKKPAAEKPLTKLEEARNTYCDWVEKIGVRGVSDIIQQVEPKEGVEIEDLPSKGKIGKFERSRPEILQVSQILKSAGELDLRGVHGYIPLGQLETQVRQVIAQKQFL